MEKNWINPEIFNLLDKKSPDFLINSNKDSVDYLKKYIVKTIPPSRGELKHAPMKKDVEFYIITYK